MITIASIKSKSLNVYNRINSTQKQSVWTVFLFCLIPELKETNFITFFFNED